ncbi:hypothetical protein GCM10009416_27190 [Craurococcus roseus]|uniref:Uncharacterized protein n=1 Tax=Craurococcus roseus TaxID=77585 RepID=A0ABN1FBL5_9PROT
MGQVRVDLLDRERVHVGAETDGTVRQAVATAAVYGRNHAMTADAAFRFDPHLAQTLQNKSGGFFFVQRQARVRVQVPPPTRHLIG